jgi:chromosomal replication initiation ATPase DnaA
MGFIYCPLRIISVIVLEAGIVLGTKRFREKVTRLLGKMKVDGELPQLKRPRDTVPIDKTVNVCCIHFGKKLEEMLKRGKGNRERQLVLYLSKILSGQKNIEVGDYFGVKGPAVSGTIKAVEERMKKEKILRMEMAKLKERVINGE